MLFCCDFWFLSLPKAVVTDRLKNLSPVKRQGTFPFRYSPLNSLSFHSFFIMSTNSLLLQDLESSLQSSFSHIISLVNLN